jgi:phosphoribosylaminoimidazolecarboxamide formyltransferase/IMP cyclohydrolase
MRAILSVYDKEGVVDFARGLEALGFELFSTGGTEGLLREAGINVRGVQEITGFPEMLGGRVKTLHPAVHGGILALRDDPGHLEELARHDLKPIDLVASNLYPFLSVARDSGARLPMALENIDIGGHTLLRAAAKNFPSVVAVCDPRDYDRVLEELGRPDGVSLDTRRRLAAKAFQHGAVYDTHVATYLRPHDEIFPDEYTLALSKVANMRSGENPHQLAAFYAEASPRPRPSGLCSAKQLHGKALSFNNTFDADLAWQAVSDFTSTCVAIVKHGNLCGLSLGDSVADAFRKALATDPQTAFGSAVAANRVIDDETAQGGDAAPASAGRADLALLCLARGQARHVERGGAGAGAVTGRVRLRPAESTGRRRPGRPQGWRAHAGLGPRLGWLLPVPRRGRAGRGCRRHGDHPARRLEPRPRADPCCQSPRHRDDLHRRAPLPPLS